MDKFYITTPIYYINGVPHLGHTYTTVVADVLARWHRSQGKEVFFLVGTDENSQKVVEAAGNASKGLQEFTDEMSSVWRETWLKLGISFDRFIRTTSPEHLNAVKIFWERVQEKGDIYLGEYEGLYCVSCEAFIKDSDLDEDGLCPDHKKKPTVLKEKNYFFKLTKYRDALLEHIEKNPDFIQPEERRNEVISFIKDYLEDISISRESVDWGISVPGDESQRIYVWFDALINYLSGIGFGQDEAKFSKFWPADVQLLGKDISKFHCALWPAMLMSADIELPKTFFVHGHWTVDGQKMSKTIGNVIDPVDISQDFPFDAVRYFILRETSFGSDGDFSFDRLKERYNSELANDLGNLFQRTLNMVDKYLDGTVDRLEDKDSPYPLDQAGVYLEGFKFDLALQEIWGAVSHLNKLIEDKKPWELAKSGNVDELKQLFAYIFAVLDEILFYLEPFMPDTVKKARDFVKADRISAPSTPLFPKKD